MRTLLIVACCLFIQQSAFADWVVTKRIDVMTDETIRTATVTNQMGHRFSIYRISTGGPAWGNFRLSDQVFDQVDWAQPPIYRIDSNDPVNLSRMKTMQEMGLGIQAYAWEPKWVNFLLWHGKQEEGLAKDLVHLMEGETLVFRYYLSTGGFKDTSFSLKGSGPAIAEAIGIDANVDHVVQEQTEAFKRAVLAEVTQCRENMRTFKECFARVDACRTRSGGDTGNFRVCMQ